MKKLSILLVLSTILVSFAGCGESGSTAGSSVSAQETSVAPAVTQAASAPVEEPDSMLASVAVEEEASPEEAGTLEETVNPNFVEMPITEESETLSVWTRSPGGNMQVMHSSYSEYEIFQELESISNIHIDWNEASNEAANTQFNLMCASGEYSDIITGVDTNYSGGLAKAYEDGIIDDMRDLIDEYAQNYTALLDSNSSIRRNCISDTGSILAFYTINDEPDMAAGLFIRQDWLDALGLDMPETYDALKDVLSAFEQNYGCDYSLMLTESCVVGDSGDLTAGFGVGGFNTKELNRYHMFIGEDGNVTSCLIEDGYREYLSYLHELYEQGLLGRDFYTVSSDPFAGTTDQLIINSRTGVFKLNTRGIDNILANAVDDTFAVSPLPNIGKEPGLINHFSDASLINTNASASISSTCRNPEAAVKWLDYWYSEDGMLMKNYGVEGESYTMEDGKPQFTDTIINNEWDVSVDTAITRYNIQNQLVGRSITNLTWDFYTELQQEAKTLWKNTADSEQVLPGSLTLTTDESTDYSDYFGDISTYVATMIPKFISGEESLDNWDNYVATLKDMGIDNCIADYQAAYDRYLER